MAIGKKKKKNISSSFPAEAAPAERFIRIGGGGEAEADMGLRSLWPDHFAPPSRALFLASSWLILTVLLCAAASFGAFTAVKESLAALLGLQFPDQVDPGNFDMAFVISALSGTVLFSLIHPSLGIGLIILARTWLDGYTFPLDNLYFVWAIYLLALIWLVRVFHGKDRPLTFPPPLVVFSLLIVYLFLTLPFSWQYGQSYPLVWLWVGYLTLFAVSLHVTGVPRIRKLLLFLFLAAMGAQALFSVLHFSFLLPYLRTIVQNPAILQRYFNTDVITPELARRFMVNRAFGSMLFPNALAGYLILGIPFAFALCWATAGSYKQALRELRRKARTVTELRERALLLGISVIPGMLVFILFLFVTYFPKEYWLAETPLPWYYSLSVLILFAMILACATALFCFSLLCRCSSLSSWWALLRFPALLALFPLLLYTLWITYSRGAFLGLLASSGFSFLLYKINPGSGLPRFFRRSAALLMTLTLVLLISLILVQSFSAHPSWAQQPGSAGESKPSVAITSEGVAVTTSDLADPTTFGFRLGYWQVAARLFFANWKWGTGLGNFQIGYPVYQFMGAGDVREAHNGYLQFFCETGLGGGLLFLVFWAYFVIWGAASVLRQQDKKEKRILAGMYAGILAFALHAALDINFSHPSLMMLALFFCGAFYGRISSGSPMHGATAEGEVPGERALPSLPFMQRFMSVVLALGLLLAGNTSFRLYKQNIALNRLRLVNLSWDEQQKMRFQNLQFFLLEVPSYALARDRGEDIKKPPRLPLSAARMLIEDETVLTTAFAFYRPDPQVPGKFHRIQEGEIVPESALAIVRKPWYLFKRAIPAGLKRIDELIAQDRRFPHSTELALHIASWYEIYAQRVFNDAVADQRPGWEANFLEWTEEVLRRNPYHADLYRFKGNAYLWLVLGREKDEESDRSYLEKAKASFEEMLKYCPLSSGHRYVYAGAMEKMAEWYRAKGDAEEAQRCLDKMGALRAEAFGLDTQRAHSHVYPR